MSNFIELQELNKSKVLVNKLKVVYFTPRTRDLNEPFTSLLLEGGIQLCIDEKYQSVFQKING